MRIFRKIINVCFCIFLLFLGIAVWILYDFGYFLPVTNIAIGGADWNGNWYDSYEYIEDMNKENYGFVTDKRIARNDGFYLLYSLKGDINKERNAIAIVDGDNRDQLCIKSGYENPLDGDMTGGIMGGDYDSYEVFF
ncbi:hypothetical protein [Clostridium sp. HBUAS56010]|uniref:hypothetical protein n=1 Tax=Clostridium sp. HBUAS56010 TaxID=2571127 RepID=UPI0011788608|nr:hypothetical protein [Clostridium sp. HBUAS56010]